jgi:hypothetical protein
MEPSELALSWTLSVRGQVVADEDRDLKLDPGDHRLVEVLVPMPECLERTPAKWHLALRKSDRVVFEDTHDYWVFPRPRPPELAAVIGLYDPQGPTRELFEAKGIRHQIVESLESIDPAIDVLAIGQEALPSDEPGEPVIGRTPPARAAIERLLARGGRILVLWQEAYPEGLFGVSLTEHQSTMTFPVAPSHPALAGTEPADLKFWRGDHLVSAHEPARPARGGTLPIVTSGSAAGIDHAPLLERPVGPGCVIHCQLKLVEKHDKEPAAARILGNLLQYLAEYRPRPPKTAVIGGDQAYRTYLESLGLRFVDLSGQPDDAELSDYSLVVCRGELAQTDRLRDFVQSGGNVLMHRVAPNTLTELNRAFQLDLTLEPYSGHVTRVETGDRLLEVVTREDLYWLGEHVGIAWRETPRAAEMADGVFSKTLDDKEVTRYEIEDWTLEGQIVERREPGVTFATVGSASAEIEFPESGQYVIGLVARGTPCDGVYPSARISVDGKPFGSVAVAHDDYTTVTTFGHVARGRHEISIAFTNDGSNPPLEDRNLYVDQVLVARDDNPLGATFLTTPPAVAVIRRGEGTLVIDQVRWDNEDRNARKAARYASATLTALGGDFPSRQGVTMQCEAMTPQPGMPHFHNRGTYVSIATNGYVETPIQVAAAGRYTMEVVASGTPAQGLFPIVEARINGRPVGQFQLTAGAWRPYFLEIQLTQGPHQLQLAFVNDLNQAGEDRNLMLDQVAFYRAQD